MRRLLLLFFISIILFPVSALDDIVLFPPDKSFFKSSKVTIVVKAESVQTSFPVVRSIQTKPYFHLLINLKSGENKIPLFIIKDGKAYKKTLTLHYFRSDNYQGEGKKYFFHKDEKIQNFCSQCHASDKMQDNICLSCHLEKKEEKSYKHEAFDPSDCSGCHEEETQEIVVSCFDCHEEKSGHLHSPYAINECFLCHDPHGTFQKALLISDVRSLCTQCHLSEDYREFVHPVHRHPMESRNISCITCHNPHGSPYSFYFQYAPEVICTKCHD
ncbi:hypothetical protein NLC26_03285 [Candidatus Aminicenantes bacterium AC-708-M15]|jgi:predicted CXXCH cytochrome family protein|nr:hypothetical protein [SCandidatus Aminicenantes bacterium Aminicenantia_JdfR_composite]MCP2598531.1 hypothetical protein [Candidatus Aminicenantes bacterium AC-335-L06]MCP2599216.1 hypothetical protein [Candidatus Aminicenantes bacterium AC-335-B20]MCP2604487.1 hypothetical protein [Candidatus Aminicenantes bacterium AC-708-M15]